MRNTCRSRGLVHAAVALVLLSFLVPLPAHSQVTDSLTLAGLEWRTVGPAVFEGRVSDIAGIPSPSRTFFVAAAAGGVFKTINGGLSFRPVFENERVSSMGALAIAPSDTLQVWAGTGEQNTRNSIEPGGGVYKSTDGGITWELMGLEETEHIARIVVHPTDPEIVYVAALGAAWRSNPERGLYRTKDGGASWELIKFVSDEAGFVDVALDPRDPDVVWASSYERIRGPWFFKSGGPGSALWKSTDGGESWSEVEGNGLPETLLGRIDFALAPSDPDIMYALIEADSLPNPNPDPAAEPQKLQSGLYRSTDGGRTWEKRNDQNHRPFYFNQVRVDPEDPDRVYFSSFLFSDDGGLHTRAAGVGIHIDHHAQWIDPNDGSHFVVGNDGGVAVTYDRGGTYDFGAVLPIAQFYEISYDFAVPYNVCGGTQDNGTWCGPSRRQSDGIQNADWYQVGGGDGFYTAIDPTDPNILYYESLGGNMSRLNKRTGESIEIQRPSWSERRLEIQNEIFLARGDTTRPPSKDAEQRIEELKEVMKRDSVAYAYRSNWNTPFILSPHNPRVFYTGANRVLKSVNRGDDLVPISPDLSKQQWEKIEISTTTTGGITTDAWGGETYGTITTLAESYVRPGHLYAGTDDGNVWMTRDDGASWEQIPADRFPGLPGDEVYVSRIEPSHFDSLTFYISFDNHRRGDFTPYVFVTDDGGQSFRSIVNGLPTGGPDFVRVIREDPHNPDLLFAGTSVAVYASLDRGESWHRFMNGMPTASVYDLKIHPRDRELIAATHGRGIWIVDIAPLEQLVSEMAGSEVHLFEPKVAFQYPREMRDGEATGGTGHQRYEAPSPPYGAEIAYRLGRTLEDPVRIVITDTAGDTLMTRSGPPRAGLHRVVWNMREQIPPEPLTPVQVRDSALGHRRVEAVFDSLRRAGRLTESQADRYRVAVLEGQYGVLAGAAFGAGGGGGPWDPRPGEGGWIGPPPDSVVKRWEEARSGSAEEPLPPLDSLFFGGIAGLQEALEVGGRELTVSPLGLTRRRGETGDLVPAGDYRVALSVGTTTQSRALQILRVTDRQATPMNGFDGSADAAVAGDAVEAARGSFDVTEYDITMDYQPATGTLQGVTVVNARATETLGRFTLQLSGLTVRSVTVDSEAAKSFSQTDANELVIVPATMMGPGASFRVRVEYDGTPGAGWLPTTSGGATAFMGSSSAWFPVHEGAHDRADFHLAATVPDGWSVVSIGRERGVQRESAASTFRWTEPDVDPARIAVSIDRMTIERSELADGTPVVNAYAEGLRHATKPLADRVPEILDFFSDKFGPYPFRSAGSVFVHVNDDGPGTAPQTRPVYLGAGSEQYMTLEVVVHEQAHQWYGVSAAPEQLVDNCLSECFASYATWLWDEAKDGVDLDARYREQVNAKKDDAELWKELYRPGKAPRINIYSKGPLALHALRRQVGDEAFDQLLQQWPQEHRGDYVDWPQFVAFAEEITGQDLTDFFQAWFRDATIPADKYLWPGALKP